ALDAGSGAVKWTYTLPAGSAQPLLASHGTDLYVIGASAQLKLNIETGNLIWSRASTFPAGEAGYIASFEDPLYRPMVLTDDTAWFVDGAGTSPSASLVGLRTSDGAIVQQIDLAALVSQKPGESLLCVNDLAESDGKLAVLLGIR